ncbi:MAG TPA: hypothetical protein EYQ14_25865 [Gammaproteobacteria bacterium]|nr:hypothetical protein [Gammaproteobacteria bacterium]
MNRHHTENVTELDVFDDAATDSLFIQFNGQEFQLKSQMADDFVKAVYDAQETRETEGWGKAFIAKFGGN